MKKFLLVVLLLLASVIGYGQSNLTFEIKPYELIKKSKSLGVERVMRIDTCNKLTLITGSPGVDSVAVTYYLYDKYGKVIETDVQNFPKQLVKEILFANTIDLVSLNAVLALKYMEVIRHILPNE